MHFLIGFGIVVGLIAFAFGTGPAAAFVRGILVLATAVIFGMAVFFTVTAWNELQPIHVPKHPRPTELAGPPGDEPRCGYACADAHDAMPRACWDWIDAGAPQTTECKSALGREAQR